MKFGRKTGKDDETAAKPDPEAGKPAADVSVSRSGRGKGTDARLQRPGAAISTARC